MVTSVSYFFNLGKLLSDNTGCEIFSFMDGFSDYNQINIRPEDQHKTTFIYPWGTFAYRKILFGLKNVGANFQRETDYDLLLDTLNPLAQWKKDPHLSI